MGRRSLRKIDPTLDLSGHLKILDDVATPFDPNQLFAHHAPLEIEVGSGKGLFLARASAAVPGHNFLGIEVSLKYARFAAAKIATVEQTNALMLHGDGLRLFREVLPDDCAAAVHVYFPDPWWKKRHKKRRVMTVEFVRDVQRVLETEGALHFWTDVEEYYQSTLALISSTTDLIGPFDVAEETPEHDLDYRTHFERRMRQHKLSVYRAEFRKR